MQSVANPFLYGFILAAILNTSANGELKVQIRRDTGLQSRNMYIKQFEMSKERAVLECASITTGESCDNPTAAKYKVYDDTKQRITKDGANQDFSKISPFEQVVFVWEYVKVEDYLREGRQSCFHDCKDKQCVCREKDSDFSNCAKHKQKNVDCTTQVAVALQLEVAKSLTYGLLYLDCIKKSLAGNGNPCRDSLEKYANKYGVDGKDSLAVCAKMSECDWEELIKTECMCDGGGKCENGTCKCLRADGSTKQQQDLDSTCKKEVHKIVDAFTKLDKLSDLEGSSKDGSDAGSQGSGAGPNAKTEQPKQSSSIAQVDVATPAMVLLGILTTPHLTISQ